MASTSTGVVPARIRYYSDAMHVEVVTTYGYRGKCRCGWEDKVRKSYREALDRLSEHKLEAHGDTDARAEAS